MPHRQVSSLGRGAGVPRLDFRCRRCGYGIVASRPPADGCPMCHAATWAVAGRTHQEAR